MIDKLQQFSQSIQFLRLPAIVVGLSCLATMATIFLGSVSHDGDRFLVPAFVGVLWAMSTYSFIVTFQFVPEKAGKTLGFFSKLKRNLYRGWYWLISVVFLGTTIVAIYLTNSLVSMWLRDYGG
jgi:hypothetical protein